MLFVMGSSHRSRERRCGAEALCALYHTFGMNVSCEEIWQRVAVKDRSEGTAAASFRLAADAIQRGFSAAVLRVISPWSSLQLMTKHGYQIIVLHRLREGSKNGHFSFVTHVSDQAIGLWNSIAQSAKTEPRDVFLKKWQRESETDEFTTRIMIAVRQLSAEAFESIRGSALRCLQCDKHILLGPLEPLMLGRKISSQIDGAPSCEAIFCPWCDAAHRLSF